MPIQGKLQVVAMDTVQRVAHSQVFVPVALDNVQQRTTLAVGDVLQSYLLLMTGYMLVVLLKDWRQLIHKSRSLTEQLLASLSHLFLPELHERFIGGESGCAGFGLPKQTVALL